VRGSHEDIITNLWRTKVLMLIFQDHLPICFNSRQLETFRMTSCTRLLNPHHLRFLSPGYHLRLSSLIRASHYTCQAALLSQGHVERPIHTSKVISLYNILKMPGLTSNSVQDKISGNRIVHNTEIMASKNIEKDTQKKPEWVGQALLDALDDPATWEKRSNSPNTSAQLVAQASQLREVSTPANGSADRHQNQYVMHPRPKSTSKWWHEPRTPTLTRIRQPIRSKQPARPISRGSFAKPRRNNEHISGRRSQEPGNKYERQQQQYQEGSRLKYDQYGATNAIQTKEISPTPAISVSPGVYQYQFHGRQPNQQTQPLSSQLHQAPYNQPHLRQSDTSMLTPSPPSFDFCNWNGVSLAQTQTPRASSQPAYQSPFNVVPVPIPPPPPPQFGLVPIQAIPPPSFPNSDPVTWNSTPDQALLNNLLQQHSQPLTPAANTNHQAQSPTWLQPLQHMVHNYQTRGYSTDRSPSAQRTDSERQSSVQSSNAASANREISGVINNEQGEGEQQAIGDAYRTYMQQQAAIAKPIPGAHAVPVTKRKIKPLPVPTPTKKYLEQALSPPRVRSTEAMPLLIILDLNGTLVHRNKRTTSIKSRPHVKEFLNLILEHHYVMIWSSAKPENVNKMVTTFLDPPQRELLVLEWARDNLGLTKAQMNEKVQVYKQLSWVWNSPAAYQKYPNCRWNQSNTVLIDDSILKASAEPFNLVQVPEWSGSQEGNNVLGQVAGYLDWLSWHEDVSCAIKSRPFKIDTEWDWQWA
jgi:hypothetical protein